MVFDLKKVFKHLKKKWDTLNKQKKERILFILNYCLNAIPLSFFVYILMSLWFPQGYFRFVGTYVCISVFLIYFEYYYVWLRRGWQD